MTPFRSQQEVGSVGVVMGSEGGVDGSFVDGFGVESKSVGLNVWNVGGLVVSPPVGGYVDGTIVESSVVGSGVVGASV